MEPNNRKVQALVDMYLNRELLLPEMQRKYVWRSTQVRDLLDSIYRDYPSGSILVWETDQLPITRDHPFEKTSQAPIGKRLLLLDGQQRVTSLAGILSGAPVRIKEGKQIKEKPIEIYFNVDHPAEAELEQETTLDFEVGDAVEAKYMDGDFYPGTIAQVEANRYYIHYDDGDTGWTDEVRDLSAEHRRQLFFQVKNKAIQSKPTWIPVTKLFQDGVGSILRMLKIGANDPNFDTYNQRLNQLYIKKDSYLYPVQVIRDKSYAEVTDIFIRVNTSGTRLRGSDLALAQITSVWPGSMAVFEQFVDKCHQKDFYIDENFLARCLVCAATNQAKFERLGNVSADKLKECWKLVMKGLERTVNFLKNSAFVDSSAMLPSPMLLIPLVQYGSTHDLHETQEIERGLLRWFYLAATWGRYSASGDTRLTQDLASLLRPKPWGALIESIWQSVGAERQLSLPNFRGKGVNSPLFFLMYVLARKNKARDLETGEIINYANFGKSNEIEFDHIFPKSKLNKKLEDLSNAARKVTINEISNLAFMTKQGNIIKTNEDPDSYFPEVEKRYGREIFARQQIPCGASLLSYDSYEAFLKERATMLADAMNKFLDELKPEETKTAAGSKI